MAGKTTGHLDVPTEQGTESHPQRLSSAATSMGVIVPAPLDFGLHGQAVGTGDTSALVGTVPTRTFRPPQPGTAIYRGNQRYLIGEALGGGHFGTVYSCSDDWGNELVAKVLSPMGSYDEVKERWLDEAAKLIQLRHPNVTYIHDVFEYEETFYIVMERCASTLHDLIEYTSGYDGRVWLMPVARCVLQAVEFMHGWGYVHKDLHGKNVFTSLIPDELLKADAYAMTFKVGDFGISRLEGDIDPLNTMLAQWMLPPESLDPNQFGLVGRTTDIYHLGLLFLFVLEGKVREFSREEILAGVPRMVAESLGSPYSPAIAKALRRHTTVRTQSALEFWRDLTSATGSTEPAGDATGTDSMISHGAAKGK